jgi:signal transduction histidine kinase/ActR/RegA family two-component response regulator
VRADFVETYADLLTAADRRRPAGAFRSVVGFSLAALLHLRLGWAWAYLWAAAYACSQLLEIWALRPAMRAAWAMPTAPRAAALVAMFTLPALIYAPIAVPVWQQAQYGPLIAVLFLAGGGLNLIIMSGVSAVAFFAPFSVFAAVWTVMLVSDNRLTPGDRGLAYPLAVLVIAKSIMAWRLQAQSLRANRAMMRDAERREQETQAALEAKGAFVAMISHDLRTPINAILTGADRIEKGGEGVRQYARMVRDAGVMMRDLLGDLLDMERMDAGAMPVEQIAFDLRLTLAETLQLWRSEAARKGLRLRVFGAYGLPRFVCGDSTRLRQVLNNLLSNAVKFTNEGAVTVRLAMTGGRLRVIVEDTGPGLGAGDPERLFRSFDQAEPGTARLHGGFGLGLAISRRLARLMGGDLSVLSAEAGARLLFELPLAQAPATPARVGPLRVLVVDDHPLNRESMTILLDPLGITPALAACGEDALETLRSTAFDLVLMDINMPGIDGREVTRRLRAGTGPNRDIPVIAVSAADTPREWRTCAEAGMNSHVAKPIRPHRLYEAINAAVMRAGVVPESRAEALSA